MNMSLLYHTLGVDCYAATRCWEKEGVFCLHIAAPSSCHRCPKCGRGDVIHRGTFDRTVHAPPIGTCRTQLFIKAPRLECRSCKQVLNAAIPKVVLHCQYTESFARLVIDLRKGAKRGCSSFVFHGQGSGYWLIPHVNLLICVLFSSPQAASALDLVVLLIFRPLISWSAGYGYGLAIQRAFRSR